MATGQDGTSRRTVRALVIGGGPAGLAAADALAGRGVPVLLAEGKPSIGRKFLMAGKSGLNLTKAEAQDAFVAAYAEAADWLAPMLARSGPVRVRDWAEELGQAVFTGSSGRVFPVAMKASPLLRAWAARLAAAGVETRTRWRWTGRSGDGAACFATPEGAVEIASEATVLAMGGASWARLGSDGAWAELIGEDVVLAPFRPANAGLAVDWSPHMARHFGTPVKAAELIAGGVRHRGEFVISARGLEGGGIYAASRAARGRGVGAGPRAGAERGGGGHAASPAARQGEPFQPPAPDLAAGPGTDGALAGRERRPLPEGPEALAARYQGAAGAPRRVAADGRGDLDRRGDPARGGGPRSDAARPARRVRGRRDAGLGGADGRLPDHRLPGHGPLGRGWRRRTGLARPWSMARAPPGPKRKPPPRPARKLPPRPARKPPPRPRRSTAPDGQALGGRRAGGDGWRSRPGRGAPEGRAVAHRVHPVGQWLRRRGKLRGDPPAEAMGGQKIGIVGASPAR